MRPLSASGIERAMACIGSVVYPAVGSTSDAAERGTALHEFITDAVAISGRTVALPKVHEKYLDECKAIDIKILDNMLGEVPRGELAIAYNTATDEARILGENIGRDYGEADADTVYTTLDLCSIDGDLAVIIELKTGKDVAPAASNAQLKTQIVGLAKAFPQVDRIEAYIAYLQDDGSWRFDRADFDQLDVDTFAQELKALVSRRGVALKLYAETGNIDVFEGDHCRYCPAIRTCPAKVSLVKSMQLSLADVTLDGMKRMAASLSLENAGEAWEKLGKYEELIKVAKKTLEDRARTEPIPLPNGKTLREVESSREYLNGGKSYPILLKTLGAEGVDKCVTLGTSKAAIERVATKDQAKTIMRELRDCGAIASKKYATVKEG